MWDQLRELCGSNDPAIQSRAEMALQIAESYQSGAINATEYADLLRDLVRLDTLDSECGDLEAKTLLVTAITTCAKLA